MAMDWTANRAPSPLLCAALFFLLPGARPLQAALSPNATRATPLVLLTSLGWALAILLAFALWSQFRRTKTRRQSDQEEISRLGTRIKGNEKRCRDLLDSAGDAIFLINPQNGRLQEVNRAAEGLLGYSAAEIPLLPLDVIFAGRQRRRYLALVKKVIRQGYGEDGELIFRRRDGTSFIGAVHARLGRIGSEEMVHGVVRDVTERKMTEQELRRRNRDLTLVNQIAHQAASSGDLAEMLQAVLDKVVSSFDSDGGGIYLVRHAGKDLELLVHHNIDTETLASLRQLCPGQGMCGRVVVSGRPRSSVDLTQDRRLEVEAVRHAGWRGFQAIPLATHERTLGVLFIFNHSRRLFKREEIRLLLGIGKQLGTAVEGIELFDSLQWQNRLTEASNRELEHSRMQLKMNLASVEESSRSLEQLDRIKSNFLALASHELRTPLTFVLASTDLLRDTLRERLSDDEKSALDAIRQGGLRLDEIVSDLLEVARLESQSIYLARERVCLPTLLQDIRYDTLFLLQERGLTLSIVDPGEIPPLVGDHYHLKKTFCRLLENAMKFTPEGGEINILAACRTAGEIQALAPVLRPFSPAFFEKEPGSSYVQITVRDTGIGIPAAEQLRVFDKFYEIGDIASHSTSQTRFGGKGVGLGLTLVKGMVEAHGGMVWVESQGEASLEPGSAFHVLLPHPPPAEETADVAN
ncbi:multi-sensor signal transduction histidine kinase [Desulfuromonas soudanensis]|uniref:histidine kinase n=2 Tax=Desulfuromonas soudanensis TaxID=1603606 RepID=A0A0M4DGH1_9BACT|nr:multi-sensor signal transduction histidine kinase [Desulfuromonas soudanensis]